MERHRFAASNTTEFFLSCFPVPPKFTKLPDDTRARSKDDVELQCRVFGKPQPKVTWLKNGELITQNDYIQISG